MDIGCAVLQRSPMIDLVTGLPVVWEPGGMDAQDDISTMSSFR